MNGQQRIGLQRALVQEALGKLRAVSELFQVEDGMVTGMPDDLDLWQTRLAEFEAWVFDESPLS